MSAPGEDEKPRAAATPERRLEWQGELDHAMADLDSRLSHPRRRASDLAEPRSLPQLGSAEVTNELLDEIAWRVAEQIRRAQLVYAPAPGQAPAPAAAPAPAPAPAPAAAVALPPPPPIDEMPRGISLVIRIRRPLFSWRFWRRRSRRRQSMITLSDFRM